MKTIPLTQGKFAIVDDCDYEYLMQWKWYYDYNGYTGRRTWPANKIVLMHREILTEESQEIDHKDGNKLNNLRSNLRYCTSSQNKWNRGLSVTNRSGYKGVSWRRDRGKWDARIKAHGKQHCLGVFTCKHEAAKAWNKAALELHSEFAYQNVIQEPQPIG